MKQDEVNERHNHERSGSVAGPASYRGHAPDEQKVEREHQQHPDKAGLFAHDRADEIGVGIRQKSELTLRAAAYALAHHAAGADGDHRLNGLIPVPARVGFFRVQNGLDSLLLIPLQVRVYRDHASDDGDEADDQKDLPDPPQKIEGSEYRSERQHGPRVVLRRDEQDRRQGDAEHNGHVFERERAAARVRHESGEHQNRRHLREFAGLKAEAPDVKPRLVPVNLDPEEQDHDQQEDHRRIKKRGDGHDDLMVIGEHYDRGQDQPDAEGGDLLLDEIGGRGGGAENAQATEYRKSHRRENEQPVYVS